MARERDQINRIILQQLTESGSTAVAQDFGSYNTITVGADSSALRDFDEHEEIQVINVTNNNNKKNNNNNNNNSKDLLERR